MTNRWDDAPARTVYAPPAYPGHDFSGTGTIWRMSIGDQTVGFVSFPGTFPPETVQWQASSSLDIVGEDYAQRVSKTLRDGAAAGASLAETLSAVWSLMPVQTTENADLSTLRSGQF